MILCCYRMKNTLRRTPPEKLAFYAARLSHMNEAAGGMVNPYRTVTHGVGGTRPATGKGLARLAADKRRAGLAAAGDANNIECQCGVVLDHNWHLIPWARVLRPLRL